MDHWEGLKDASWFWYPEVSPELTILGSSEALETIERAFSHPSYLPLEILAESSLPKLELKSMRMGDKHSFKCCTIHAFPLNHYIGQGSRKQRLQSVGWRVSLNQGPTVCYLCDHEPTPQTASTELQALKGSQLAVLDAHFPSIEEQAYGHGSLEHAAMLAQQFPQLLVLAAHHSPTLSDEVIRAAYEKLKGSSSNFLLAKEGTTYSWVHETGVFRLLPPAR